MKSQPVVLLFIVSAFICLGEDAKKNPIVDDKFIDDLQTANTFHTRSWAASKEPIPLRVFMERFSIDDTTMAEELVEYASACIVSGKDQYAHVAIATLGNLQEDISKNFLLYTITNNTAFALDGPTLFVFARKYVVDSFPVFMDLLKSDLLPIEKRRTLYDAYELALCTFQGKSVPMQKDMEKKYCTGFENLARLETDHLLRIRLDSFLCGYLECWKKSESRRNVVHAWDESTTNETEKKYWKEKIDEMDADTDTSD